MTLPAVPARFLPVYRTIQLLEQHERYQAAFIFGSVARDEATDQSDLDAIVIVDEDNLCTNVNHPFINGVKLDLTFRSLERFRNMEQHVVDERIRPPLLAESLIVFDKTGELELLREQLILIRPYAVPKSEHQYIQFLIYHENNKVERNLVSDPFTALYAMHTGIYELLKQHFRLNQRWQLSSKRFLKDLRTWDADLASIVERFVVASGLEAKFQLWSAIIDSILAPLGGRMPIEENNCTCEVCQQDLATFLEQA